MIKTLWKSYDITFANWLYMLFFRSRYKQKYSSRNRKLEMLFFHINWFWSRYHVAICRNLQYDFSVIHIVGCVKVRCCGFIKHPEIEIVNINDEYYVNNDNFQERIKDLKYFNHYCYSKSRFLLFFLLVCYIGFLCDV